MDISRGVLNRAESDVGQPVSSIASLTSSKRTILRVHSEKQEGKEFHKQLEVPCSNILSIAWFSL